MEIKEYPLNTNYLVYSDGRIYSKRMKKFLTPKNNWDGYNRIQIWEHNKCKFIGFHRVIAETFLGKPSELHNKVNHKNGDNRVENLEWVTQQENIQHAWNTGLSTSRNHSKLHGFIVYNCENDTSKEYDVLTDIVNDLKIDYHTLWKAWKKGSRCKGKYIIKLKCND